MNEIAHYRVGIDVGTHSVGFAAIEIDDKGLPVKLLNSVVNIHDSGVDPEQAKAAVTRLASSGVARRTRRLIQRRRKRLRRLDTHLQELGCPIIDHEESSDPYLPWNMRAKLATQKLEGEELNEALSIALRHMARHRGWRSPYAKIQSLFTEKPPSEQFEAMKKKVTEISGVVFDDDVTPAEVVVDLGLNPGNRLRTAAGKKYDQGAMKAGKDVEGEEKLGVFGGKLMQSDNAGELWKIARVQGLDSDFVKKLIFWVFEAESPVGKAGERAGYDALPGQEKERRAPKAHPEFQRFRIVSVVANLRIRDAEKPRLLTDSEKHSAIDLLMSADGEDGITWTDVAEAIGVSRDQVEGTAKLSAEGERPSAFPPIDTTNKRILESKFKPLVTWWKEASLEEQAALVIALSNADELKENEPGAEATREFLASLSDEDLEKLDSISLPAGRASYSVDSLQRLTTRMFEESIDLDEARKREFGVDDSWTPPSEPIGAPVGNPAVDRVLKIVNRWLMAVVKRWGPPTSINIEHIRSGFSSESMVREYERELAKRNERNRKVVEEARADFGITSKMRPSDIRRFIALRRQNSQCLYCGSPISFHTAEMDHIVPRKGEGSTNTRDNLAAVCEICNKSKSNLPFAVWASRSNRPGVSLAEAVERVRTFIDDPGINAKQNRNFKRDVASRLNRTSEDEAIDNRSIESVAWMANELRDRIQSHFKKTGDDVKVRVFRGAITAEGRKASGFEGKVQLIGYRGKTRLDRRHHAMDAAVIALMSDYVAQTLVERDSKRYAEYLEGRGLNLWKEYRGKSAGHQLEYGKWLNKMNRLVGIFNDALINDEIPVMQAVRLRLGNGTAHDATIRKFSKKKLGEAWTRDEIDRASTPQMWIALSRDPNFSDKEGLPEDSERKLRVKNEWFGSEDELDVLPKKIAAIAVRGGYAEVGNTIHHARLYRIPGKRETYGMIRVFARDLVKHADGNLFEAPLGPESISMRDAKPATRDAVLKGDAEYLGWIVPGTELEIDLSGPSFQKFSIGKMLEDFPGTNRWVIKGFEENSRLTLRPVMLAGEGLASGEYNAGSAAIIGTKGKGWRPSIGALTKSNLIRIVHRNVLGEPRESSRAGLPSVRVVRDS